MIEPENTAPNNDRRGLWTMGFTLRCTMPNYKAKSPYELLTDKERKALEISWLLFGK